MLGYYAIIQYCPDLSRLETANVGVLLFCPETGFLKARTTRGNARIRRFFGDAGRDWARINSFKLGIEQRIEGERGQIKTIEDLARFIDQRANSIQITPPRPIKVQDPQHDLDHLFLELVGLGPRAARLATLRRFLLRKFTQAGLLDKIQRDIQIDTPFFERRAVFPFGYQDDRFNLIRPASFDGLGSGGATTAACRYAVEGESLYQDPDSNWGKLQLIVVGAFGSSERTCRPIVERILAGRHVILYTPRDVERLVDQIRRTARDIAEYARR